MRKALLFVLLAGLAAAGCAPGAGLYEDEFVDPAEQVAMMPAVGGTVQLAEDGILSGLRAGVLVSMAFPQDDEDLDWESTSLLVEGVLQFQVPMGLGLDARVGFMTYESEAGGDDLEVMPVSVMLTYNKGLLPDKVALYFGLGLAFLFNDIEEAAEVDSVDDAVGLKAALGVNISVGQHLTIGIDASYMHAVADFDFSSIPDEEFDIDNAAVGISIMGHF